MARQQPCARVTQPLRNSQSLHFTGTLQGHPIYAPKAARFVFSCGEDVKARPVGSTPDSDTDEDPETDALLEEAEEAGYATIRSCARFSAWETRTEAFPMSQSDELQMFEFKRPILCVGGLVKVRLSIVFQYRLETGSKPFARPAVPTPRVSKPAFDKELQICMIRLTGELVYQ